MGYIAGRLLTCLAVLMIRTAISPLLAIRSVLRCSIFKVYLQVIHFR